MNNHITQIMAPSILCKKYCHVYKCHNRTKPMFRMPNPRVHLIRFQQWVQAARNPRFKNWTNKQIYERASICHVHFKPEDFIQGAPNKLTKIAVPTINLPTNVPESDLRVSVPLGTSIDERGFSSIDMPSDDLDPYLVEDELVRNLFLFDAKTININNSQFLWGSDSFTDIREPTSASDEKNELEVDKVMNPEFIEEEIIVVENESVKGKELVEKDEEKLKESNFLIGKPYFKSVKCYMKDCNEFAEVCRICFRSITKEEEVLKLYGQETSMEEETQMKNILKLVLPDMDLELYPNTVICTKCTELVAYSYQLKELWLSTEAKLQKILEKKKAVISQDADLIIVKKELKMLKENDYDHVDINGTNGQTDGPIMTSSTLERLLTANNTDYPANVKVYHGDLNMSSTRLAEPACRNKRTKEISCESHAPHLYDMVKTDGLLQTNRTRKKTKDVWGLGPFMCEQCGRLYTNVRALKRHLKSHLYKEKKIKQPKERKIMCETCGQLFFTSHSLKSHRRIHRDPKCSICGQGFEHIKTLKKHIFQVHSRSSFQCHLCGKQYPYVTSLRTHMFSHYPKRRRHACPVCNKKFIHPAQVRKHARTHSNHSWGCTYCGKTVKYEHSLQRHIKIYHMDQGEFVCEFCDRPYWKKIDLQKHRIRIHGYSHELQEKPLIQNDNDSCTNLQS